jgi:hypothetical protein
LGRCKKSDESSIEFTGITRTDNFGAPLSNDPDDWTFSDQWAKKEASLFQSAFSTTCTPGYAYKIVTYPNPCSDVCQLNIDKPSGARLEIRVVDKNFRQLIANDAITSSAVALNVGTFGVKGIVRLYYKLIDNDCEFRGHGDILIQ